VKSTVENLTPTRVRLAVEVSFDELKPSLDAAYKRIGESMRVPGFRPGKAPARIIEQRVGRGAVLEEAVNDALPKAYSEAVRETGVRTLGQPDIEVTNLDDGQSLSFTAEVDVRPEFSVPPLDSIAVSVDDVEVTDAEVEEQLDGLRDRFGTLVGVDRPVETGDFVALDLTTTVDGVELEDGAATGLSYEVGSGDLIDGLDEVLPGVSVGGTATLETVLQQGEHSGDTASVNATVTSVKVKDLPAADDDFAQLASEFDTIDELRGDLRTRLGRVKALTQGSQARDKVLEYLIDNIEFDAPESAVTAEAGYREHDVIHSMNHDDDLFARFLESQGKTKEEFDADLRESAIRSVKAQLILDSIADAEELGVNDTELTDYLVRQAARYNMSPQDFANQIMEAGNLPSLIADVRRNKALALVLSSATVTDASGTVLDVSALAPAILDEADDLDEFADGDHEGHDHGDHEGHDHGDHEGHDHGDHDHGDHDHDHGGGE
jgi:trigger factor